MMVMAVVAIVIILLSLVMGLLAAIWSQWCWNGGHSSGPSGDCSALPLDWLLVWLVFLPLATGSG